MQDPLYGLDERSIRPSDRIVGAAVGLAFGVLLVYLVLFFTRYVSPNSFRVDLGLVPPLIWLVPVLTITTGIGVRYYGVGR